MPNYLSANVHTITKNAEISMNDQDGWPYLYLAAAAGLTKMVEFLLDNGVELEEISGVSPMIHLN